MSPICKSRQTFGVVELMHSERRDVPLADVCSATNRVAYSITSSARGEECRRYVEAKCFRGPEVDHKLKFGCLYHWQVRRLGSLQRSAQRTHLAGEHIGNIGSVADQATRFGIFMHRIYCRN